MPQQISTQQLKAARALLNWNQAELAQAANLSLPAIAKIEAGMTQPRSDTMQALRSAFEQNGIEFLDNPGVQMRQEPFGVNVMRGEEGMLRLFKDIESTLANGGELLLSSVDERFWVEEFTDDFWATIRRRRALGIKIRLLICEGDNMVVIDSDVYRSLPKAVFSSTAPHLIYHNKMAIIQVKPTLQIVIIESQAVADTFRAVFEHNWRHGKKLPRKGLKIIPLPRK